jgi:hypothetical protein
MRPTDEGFNGKTCPNFIEREEYLYMNWPLIHSFKMKSKLLVCSLLTDRNLNLAIQANSNQI